MFNLLPLNLRITLISTTTEIFRIITIIIIIIIKLNFNFYSLYFVVDLFIYLFIYLLFMFMLITGYYLTFFSLCVEATLLKTLFWGRGTFISFFVVVIVELLIFFRIKRKINFYHTDKLMLACIPEKDICLSLYISFNIYIYIIFYVSLYI
eukprot:gene5629-4046_t